MRKIKSPGLAQLLMQLRYTPVEKRRKQLEATEKLIAIIDKQQQYPFEFIFFRITGFHIESQIGDELTRGDELLEDLRIFISKLSGQVAMTAEEVGEKISTVRELAQSAGVSTKTIYRWRKQGLVAEKYIFEDGAKRLGFRQSIIDDFFAGHPELAKNAKTFSRLSEQEKKLIIKRASKLAAKSGLSRHQIITKICRELDRSHETVRYTLAKHDEQHPEKAVFANKTYALEPTQEAEIYKLFKQGCDIKELMSRFDRNKSSIYRIINKRRAKALLAHKITFIDSEEFPDENASQTILSGPEDRGESIINDSDIERLKIADDSLPEYLRMLKNAPVLNRDQEVMLFRRYNYLKYLAHQEQLGLRGSRISGGKLNRIENYLSRAEEVKRRIIEANLRLIITIARRHTSYSTSLFDFISEGNLALMRAVEKYDYTKGFRFTTFASWTIAKSFARKLPEFSSRLTKTTAASIANKHRQLKAEDTTDFAAIERVHKSLTKAIKDNLSEREQYIIMNRFGLIGSPIRKQTKTLLQIGTELNISKERVRQIELTALHKLRQSLSPEEFELLTS